MSPLSHRDRRPCNHEQLSRKNSLHKCQWTMSKADEYIGLCTTDLMGLCLRAAAKWSRCIYSRCVAILQLVCSLWHRSNGNSNSAPMDSHFQRSVINQFFPTLNLPKIIQQAPHCSYSVCIGLCCYTHKQNSKLSLVQQRLKSWRGPQYVGWMSIPSFCLLLFLLAVVVIWPHRCCINWFHSFCIHSP